LSIKEKNILECIFLLIFSFCIQANTGHPPDIQASSLQKNAQIEAPIRVVSVNCPVWGYCDQVPKLNFQLQERVGGYDSYNIQVVIGTTKENCEGETCLLEMPITDADGVRVEYYALTGVNNETRHQEFTMRNLKTDSTQGKYLFEILGEEWQDQAAPCAYTWMLYPSVEEEQTPWMTRVNNVDQLLTFKGYSLLAGKLIWYGFADASQCEDSGLLENKAASECGISAAMGEVTTHQNQYNQLIMGAAQQTNIPARILKGVVAQESQFWPDWPELDETGFGMLSNMGMDMLLSWNPSFYLDVCSKYYGEVECGFGYSSLTTAQQEFLQNVSLRRKATDQEFDLIAETLVAGCNQTAQIVDNYTDKEINEVTDYETLWRMTLGIYHAGSGCIGDALEDLVDGLSADEKLDLFFKWKDLVKNLPEGCESAATYFDKVVRYGN
jgi:hypothetical protein